MLDLVMLMTVEMGVFLLGYTSARYRDVLGCPGCGATYEGS